MKTAINLVSKISLLGDDREEPQTAIQIYIILEAEKEQLQILKLKVNVFLLIRSEHTVQLLPISFFPLPLLKLYFLIKNMEGQDVWDFPRYTTVKTLKKGKTSHYLGVLGVLTLIPASDIHYSKP